MKHRISLLSTTGLSISLLWLAAAALPERTYAFDIHEGEIPVTRAPATLVMRERINLSPTPTQASRKGLVFPRVYDDAGGRDVPPIAFAPLGSKTAVQAASNTLALPVPAPAVPVYSAPVAAAPAPQEYVPPAVVAVPVQAPAVAPHYAAIAPAASANSYSTIPAPVQRSTRVFDPLQVAASAPAASPAVDTQAVPSAVGAPEPLVAAPLPTSGPKVRSAQNVPNPTQPIVPPVAVTVSAPLADLPKEQLSRKTKTVIGTIPSKLDAAKVEKTEKFDLSRTAASVDALDSKAGKVDAYEAAGIKISVRRPGLDTNYELNRAYNALTSGDTAAAMQTYKDILSVEPTNADALFGLASLYHRQGDVAHARPLYAVLLKNYPTHREGINNFLVLVSDESPQEALAELERLEQRNPDFSPIPAQQALVLERLGYSSEAQAKMARAIELAPENLTYKYNLAVMMDRQKNYSQAIALYRLLLDSSSKGAPLPAPADTIQRRLNHLATIVNSGNIPTVGSSRTL